MVFLILFVFNLTPIEFAKLLGLREIIDIILNAS